MQSCLSGRRKHPGLALPRGIGRLRKRLARAHPGQPDARRDGAGLLSPLRDRLQPRARSTRPSASIRSSASSATRRSSAAGDSRRRKAETGKRVLVVGAGPSGLSAAYHLRRLGPRRGDSRGRAGGRRDDALRHSEIPLAARRARRGNKADSRPRRRTQAQRQGRQHSRDDESGRVRRGIPRRRRPYRQARLYSGRRGCKDSRCGHGAALDGRRGQAAARPARRGLRRRQHRDRRRAHRQAHGRHRGDHRLSPHPRTHAGARLRGRGGAARKAS